MLTQSYRRGKVYIFCFWLLLLPSTCIMSRYNPSPTFQDAAAYLSNESSLSKVSTAAKLELYGLYKYLTISSEPNVSRPSYFDMTGRAKWDAWSGASKTYKDRGEDAEKRYLDIARNLGWIGGGALVLGADTTSPSSNDDVENLSGDIWDEESSSSSKGGGSGMGTSVSAMAPPPHDEKDARTIHGLAISNNTLGLSLFLQAQQNVDVNKFDEHGYTPLHLACDRGNAAVVELLLSKGADHSLKDPDELTALELATIAGHDDIVALIQED